MKNIFNYIFSILLSVILISFLFNCERRDFILRPAVSTGEVLEVGALSMTVTGEFVDYGEDVTNISAFGHCWSLQQGATIESNKIEVNSYPKEATFFSTLTNLKPNTNYFINSYVIAGDYISYANEKMIKTTSSAGGVSTLDVTDISYFSAVSGGRVHVDILGDSTINRGLYWSETDQLSYSLIENEDKLEVYTDSILGLSPNTHYLVKAYVTNDDFTEYGNTVYFKTLDGTHFFTNPIIRNVGVHDVTMDIYLPSDIGYNITEKGICWSTLEIPTIESDKKILNNNDNILVTLSDLDRDTTYFVRSYVRTDLGELYSNQISFRTKVGIPEVSTLSISEVTHNSGIGSGNVISDGGLEIISRGLCWNTSGNPTIQDNISIDGTGSGIFTSQLNDLAANAKYYVRAYATNSYTTTYGGEVDFTTYGYVYDIDSNFYYSIQIGVQEWMAENLKTTQFNDGTLIPLVHDYSVWANTNNSAYCWMNNDESHKDSYGALYNWYVVETGKLCPDGWHVPSNNEWTILVEYLGGEQVAGGKLKAIGTEMWHSPNYGATNESRFSAVPGGLRNFEGRFVSFNLGGNWWSQTLETEGFAWYLGVSHDKVHAHRYYNFVNNGNSIRCLKD